MGNERFLGDCGGVRGRKEGGVCLLPCPGMVQYLIGLVTKKFCQVFH